MGGAEQMMLGMANEFVQRRWQVHVVCLTKAGELASRLSEQVQLHVLNKRPGLDVRLPAKLLRCMAQIKPDVINSHLWVGNAWTRLSLIRTATPIIATEHSRDSWKPFHYRLLDRLLARRTYKLVAVSQDTAAFYQQDIGLDGSLITVINNGIDVPHYAQGNSEPLRTNWLMQKAEGRQPRDTLLIGTVGRLVPAKNHRRLIDAIRHLIEDTSLAHLRIVLKIVGEGPERDSLQRYIDQRGLGEHISLTGVRHDIPDVLSAFDIFVLSSDREGHPLTVLEAQAAGTPVVLTDAGGSKEAIARKADQVGGVLVEKSYEALSAALRTLILNPGLRQQYSRFASHYALEHFDFQRMSDRYQSLFESALGRHSTERN